MALIRIVHIVLSYLVLPYLIVWYFFVGMNAYRAGYYPYSRDHPASYLFGSDSYLGFMQDCFMVALFTLPAWFVLSLVLKLVNKYQIKRRHAIIFLVSAAIFFFHFYFDPALAWYID